MKTMEITIRIASSQHNKPPTIMMILYYGPNNTTLKTSGKPISNSNIPQSAVELGSF